MKKRQPTIIFVGCRFCNATIYHSEPEQTIVDHQVRNYQKLLNKEIEDDRLEHGKKAI